MLSDDSVRRGLYVWFGREQVDRDSRVRIPIPNPPYEILPQPRFQAPLDEDERRAHAAFEGFKGRVERPELRQIANQVQPVEDLVALLPSFESCLSCDRVAVRVDVVLVLPYRPDPERRPRVRRRRRPDRPDDRADVWRVIGRRRLESSKPGR